MRDLFFVLPVSSAFALSSCSQGGGTTIGCPGGPYPVIQMLYPIPSATNIPTDVSRVVISAPYPYSGSLATGVPIELRADSTASIEGIPTALPTTLPQSAATPDRSGVDYAVSLPNLSESTTYHVFATTAIHQCEPPTQEIGMFKTQYSRLPK